ncbi:MAG TPA: ADP-ribosylglycohydrolase family protein [Candidatus Melainabacteria bacterium]|nr:ADP-ribosylglycohydrolase family protein [Candidatus Melainabacteria bacterium]
MDETQSKDRFRGCLMGLAAGDALGTTLEFSPPGTFKKTVDMVGGGPFQLEAGQWTDDTSMALCLAESLIESDGFDAADQMRRYCLWMNEGHLSVLGWCFDIGRTTANALKNFENTAEPYSGSTARDTQANGSMMRLAPVAMLYANAPVKAALGYCADSSRTTHGHVVCQDACRFLGALIICALKGMQKEAFLLEHPPIGDGDYWSQYPLSEDLQRIAAGSYRQPIDSQEIAGIGYAPKSLEAALWAFHHSTCFEDGALLAVNLGDDADTTGAIYGQLAGAYYGLSGIPKAWLEKIAMKDLILDYADKLFEKSAL